MESPLRRRSSAAFVVLLLTTTVAFAQPKRVVTADRADRSPRIGDMRPVPPAAARAPFAVPNKFYRPSDRVKTPDLAGFADQSQQASSGQAGVPEVVVNVEGSTEDDNAAVVGWRVVPPDVQGDVGPNHYFQFINSVFEIFNKNGSSLTGPLPGNQFWGGFGGRCESDNDGDPVVLYDDNADRWLVSQFSVSSAPYYMCIAVSTTGNPTGAYHRYAFSFGPDFPDYPKFGVWPDAYYMTTRNFPNGGSFAGVQAVAFDRAKMLTGDPTAAMVVFDVPGGTANDGWLPAHNDGGTPPAGSPGIFMGAPETVGSNQIVLYAFDVDWSSPGSSTFTQLATLPVNAFDISVYAVQQPRGGEQLDVLPWFLMYRAPYRNFGTHQTLLLNHTVDAGGNRAGIRWYELRNTGSSWTLHQQGTYAPEDGLSRWMGSIAMNSDGDIALAYSVASRDLFPSLRFTGQTAGRSDGIMDIAETEIHTGSGVQKSNSYGRWGDYSALSVDPTDDSFWYTGEYYANSAAFDFKTRIASFTLGTTAPPPPPGDPTYLEVASLSTGQQSVGGGDKLGTATVIIEDDLGNPVPGADVTGQFSGSVSGTSTQTTNASGAASFTSATSARGKITVNFCVSDVDGSLPNVPNSTDCSVSKGSTSADLPETAALAQNYPNPFNPTTIIGFELPETAFANLSVYNMIGQRVATLVDGTFETGQHRVSFDASGLTPGVYVYVLKSGETTITRRMTLLK